MAEQDDTDDVEDQEDEQADAVEDDDDTGPNTGEQPDSTEDEDPAALKAAAMRRKIAQRATERREENERIARETGRATAEETIRATESARARTEQERLEREGMAAMTEEQRATYVLAKQTKQNADGLTQTQRLVQSSSDQSRFDRMLNKKPQFEKYADEVDTRHQRALSNGQFVPREAILAHLIGERALADTRTENVRKQKDAAGRRVRDARGNSGRAARGDATGRAAGTKSVVQKAEEADWAI